MTELLKHPFLSFMLVVWASAAVGSIATRKTDAFHVAGVVTIIVGMGYALWTSK